MGESGCNISEKEERKENPLTEPVFSQIEDYQRDESNEWILPELYIKWTEPEMNANAKIQKKLARNICDNDVEYEVDEMDNAWLELINLERGELPPVSADVIELLFDHLEKETFLQLQSTVIDQRSALEDEAVCCVCINGECLDTNMIIFCDVCNIAVHQECYGVPYIPEGPWICRRCLVCPSEDVDCIFCPNKGGAFKKTEDGRWAHVQCTLWIPEVSFSNTTFLEPVEGVELIPASRLRLICFICKRKSDGYACIQCHKSRCYVAFHVSCAQLAGIYMKMEVAFKGQIEIIKKIAFCNKHIPNDKNPEMEKTAAYRLRLKECRKILAEKRSMKQYLPQIQPKTLDELSVLINFPEKNDFITRLVSYWKLKRIQQNGVPLLRSLRLIRSKMSSLPRIRGRFFKRKPNEDDNTGETRWYYEPMHY